jgi:hypothetical protein
MAWGNIICDDHIVKIFFLDCGDFQWECVFGNGTGFGNHQRDMFRVGAKCIDSVHGSSYEFSRLWVGLKR